MRIWQTRCSPRKKSGTTRPLSNRGTKHIKNTRYISSPSIRADRKLNWTQKYHSLAAKGEKVNVAALNTEQKSTNDSEQPEQQNPAEINLGSEDFAEDQVTAKIQSAPTVAAVRTIPQALAATGKTSLCQTLISLTYSLRNSARRRHEEPDDVLVLRRLLHRTLRGQAARLC